MKFSKNATLNQQKQKINNFLSYRLTSEIYISICLVEKAKDKYLPQV
jgi:hypothetical protein